MQQRLRKPKETSAEKCYVPSSSYLRLRWIRRALVWVARASTLASGGIALDVRHCSPHCHYQSSLIQLPRGKPIATTHARVRLTKGITADQPSTLSRYAGRGQGEGRS